MFGTDNTYFGTLDWIGHVIIFIDIFMEGELFNIRNSLLLREIDGYVRMLLNRNTTFHKQNMICTYISWGAFLLFTK